MSARGCFHEGCDAVAAASDGFGPSCVCAFATPDPADRSAAVRAANQRAVEARFAAARWRPMLAPSPLSDDYPRSRSLEMPSRSGPVAPQNIGASTYTSLPSLVGHTHCDFVYRTRLVDALMSWPFPFSDGAVSPSNLGDGEL